MTQDIPTDAVNPPPEGPRDLELREPTESANERVIQLQRLSATLAGATTTEQVADAILAYGFTVLGANAGSVALLSEDGKEFITIRCQGYPPEVTAKYKRYPIETRLPNADTARTGQPLFVETLSERDRLYPHLARKTASQGRGAMLALPLAVEGRVLGGIGFSFPTDRPFDAHVRTFVLTVAQLCTLALERTLRTEAEAAARQKREEAQKFMADASALLVSSLDVERTLDNVARMAVPHLADWCIIHLADPEGILHEVAVSHVDPGKVTMAREVGRRYPVDPHSPGGIYAVLRSGQTACTNNIPGKMLRAAARNKAHFRILQEVGIRSFLCVALEARGRRLGTITFIGAESGHRYGPEEVALAEELARRAALAVDNASLYREAREEIARRKRIEAELHGRQEEIEALNARLRRSMAETHHRVKNNLQVISALADMSIEEDESVVPVEAVRRISQHTQTLAFLHDLLTQQAKRGASVDTISVQALMEKLIPLVQSTVGERPIRTDVQDFPLSSREGTSLALLANELLSNAVKHGQGQITLALQANANQACLEVCDEGPGFPSGFDPHLAANTGLELVQSVACHDLRGTVSYENRPEGGARVSVHFPIHL